MTSFLALEWVWLAAGITLASIAFLTLLWALFGDRPRGRRRCPRCWYDMAGAEASGPDGGSTPRIVCPECGKTTSRPAQLTRTRRRWRWAALAMLMLAAAYPLALFPQVRVRGWMWLAPDRLLLEVVPLTGADSVIGQEMLRRAGSMPWPGGGGPKETWTHADFGAFLDRARVGNWLARPIDDRWRASYGELLRQVYERFSIFGNVPRATGRFGVGDIPPELADAVDAMLELPVEMSVRTRDRWPRGVPVHIEAPVHHWWPQAHRAFSHATWRVSGASSPLGQTGFSDHFEIASPPEGDVTLEVAFKIQREVRDENYRLKPMPTLLERTVTVKYRTVDSIDDIMTAVADPALDALLASGFKATWMQGNLMVNVPTLKGTPYEGVSFGVTYEVFADDVLMQRGRLRWVGGSNSWTIGDTESSNRESPKHADPSAKWTIRLRTDPAWSLYNLDATRYWKGEVTLPVTKR